MINTILSNYIEHKNNVFLICVSCPLKIEKKYEKTDEIYQKLIIALSNLTIKFDQVLKHFNETLLLQKKERKKTGIKCKTVTM